MKKLFLTIIVLSIGAIGFFIYDQVDTPDGTGSVTIILVDENGDIVFEEEHSFDEEDTFFDLMKEHYDLTCANLSYQAGSCDNTPIFGAVLLGIDDVQTDWINSYIAIYINDEYSNVGIDQIALEDKATYRFEHTDVEEAPE